MTLERTAQIIQVAYPQVYLACHTRHQRKRTSMHRLSSRDSSILAHLDATTAMPPARLATHLSIARSTLSEALKRLTALGYTRQTTRSSANGERGGVGILLTPKGLAAIRETSVLETPRLREVLETLSAAELRAVARGMSVLANACSRRNGKASAPSTSREQ
ncbi:MAG: MarR family winged helix-turn-helix transcriptional regulator [bacterium]